MHRSAKTNKKQAFYIGLAQVDFVVWPSDKGLPLHVYCSPHLLSSNLVNCWKEEVIFQGLQDQVRVCRVELSYTGVPCWVLTFNPHTNVQVSRKFMRSCVLHNFYDKISLLSVTCDLELAAQVHFISVQ